MSIHKGSFTHKVLLAFRNKKWFTTSDAVKFYAENRRYINREQYNSTDTHGALMRLVSKELLVTKVISYAKTYRGNTAQKRAYKVTTKGLQELKNI